MDKRQKPRLRNQQKRRKRLTKSNGDYVEVPIEDDNNNNGNDNNDKENGNGGNNNGGNDNENLKPNPVTPQEPDNKGETTGKELTTIEASKDKVPSTNASGKGDFLPAGSGAHRSDAGGTRPVQVQL